MSTQSLSLSSYDTTNTTGLRSLGSTISTTIQATGITKTSDTGQIDWTTVNFANNTALGYEVYRFNDTLQSTAPVFFKIAYSTGSAGQLYVSGFTIGKTTNGAGTLGSPTADLAANVATNTSGSVTGSGIAFRFVWNSTLGFFGMQLFDNPSFTQGSANVRQAYLVSRACDASGSPGGSGVYGQHIGGHNSSSLTGTHTIYSYDSGTTYSWATPVPGFNATTPTTLMVGTTVQFLRQLTAFPTICTIPQVLYYLRADVPTNGTQVTLSPYGTSHTYITVGYISSASATTAALAMLWE